MWAMLAISVAMFGAAVLAWDFGVRWLADRASARVQENVLGEITARLDTQEAVTKRLAEEWRVKFVQLENDWKKLKEHADSQYAGAAAQLTSTQSRGFGR